MHRFPLGLPGDIDPQPSNNHLATPPLRLPPSTRVLSSQSTEKNTSTRPTENRTTRSRSSKAKESKYSTPAVILKWESLSSSANASRKTIQPQDSPLIPTSAWSPKERKEFASGVVNRTGCHQQRALVWNHFNKRVERALTRP